MVFETIAYTVPPLPQVLDSTDQVLGPTKVSRKASTLHEVALTDTWCSVDGKWGRPGTFSPATDTLHRVKRVHRKLFRLNEEIAALQAEAGQVAAELEYHRSINDDAQRDAAVGNYIDREEAGLTRADVRRFEKTLAHLEERTAKLVAKRDRLLSTLPS